MLAHDPKISVAFYCIAFFGLEWTVGISWAVPLDIGGDFDYIEQVLFKRIVSPTEVAAIVVESWLGEGGYVLPPEGWFRYLRDLCDAHGILLVCDEVQSGVGRSGTMWAIEQEGVNPDIITSGKGIASGLPLGAMTTRDDLMVWELGAHGSTYGGSPISCAAALATLDVIEEEGLIDNARTVGEVFLAGLHDLASRHPIITDVRGRALWIGMSWRVCIRGGPIAAGTGRKIPIPRAGPMAHGLPTTVAAAGARAVKSCLWNST